MSVTIRDLMKATDLMSEIRAGLETIGNSLAGNDAAICANMQDWTRTVAKDISQGTELLLTAQKAAEWLSTIIDYMKENTALRLKSHERAEWLAKGAISVVKTLKPRN